MSVNNVVVDVKEKAEFKLSKKIFPAQPDIPTSIDYKKPDFVKPDSWIYESDNPFPANIIKVVNEGYFDGSNHIVTLAIYPVQYFPASDKIEVISKVNFRLNFKGSNIKAMRPQKRDSESQKLYDIMLTSIINNPEDIFSYQVKPMEITSGSLSKSNSILSAVSFYKYVIITTNALQNSFTKFVNWEKRKGLNIGVVTIENILANYTTGDVTSGIDYNIYHDRLVAGNLRMYLTDAYNSGTIYALFVGPASNSGAGIPFMLGRATFAGTSYDIPADIYFSDLTGDWNVDGDQYFGEQYGDNPDLNPEIFTGRVLCQSDQEVQNWTNKIIEYEQHPFKGNYSALTRAIWSQSDEMQRDREAQRVAGNFPSYFNQLYKEEQPSYDSNPQTGPSGAEIISDINNGYSFYNIYNHGDTYWALVSCPGVHGTGSDYYAVFNLDESMDPWNGYRNENYNGLNNITRRNESTLIYSIGCDNAQFDDIYNRGQRCMADVFTTLQNSGGPAFLGNTRVGWISSSYLLHEQFIRRLFNDNIYNLGCTEASSKSAYGDYFLAYTHNLFGCPEMPVWTTTPSQFTGVSITDAGGYITVNAGVSGCTITACSMDNGAGYYVSAVNQSSYTFNTTTRPLYITITRQNYIPYSAITGGTLSSSTSWSGELTVTGNITVTSGITLTINPNTNIKFNNNSSLFVNGTLNAVGNSVDSVTFDFIAPNLSSTNGIRFNNGSTGSISYAKIKNAYYGIYCSHSSPSISQTTFINNNYGIYCYDNSSPSVINNTISSSRTQSIGLQCSYYSSPTLAVSSGNNVITQNYIGVNTDHYSLPFIGGTYSGNNSLFGNTLYNISANYNGGKIYAYHTWWGSYPISSQDIAKIYQDVSSPIDYSSPSMSDPNSGRSLSKSSIAEADDSDTELMNSQYLLSQGKYDEAIESYGRILNKKIKSPEAVISLAKIGECYEKSGKKDFIDYLNKMIRPKLSKDDELFVTSIELENSWMIREGRYEDALKGIKMLKGDYSDRTETYKYALFNEGYTYLIYLKDKAKAKQTFEELSAKYPQDQLVYQSKVLLGEDPGQYPAQKPGSNGNDEKQVQSVTSLPKSYELLGNYPNPFNPSTTIRYALPKQSLVEVKIYNIMGNEVRSFTMNSQQAGYHDLQWDGKNMNNEQASSGTYIYRLKAVSYEDGKIFERSAKMMLVK